MLGGAKVGGGAWGVAWVVTVMTMPQQQQEDRWAKEREKYMDLIDLPPHDRSTTAHHCDLCLLSLQLLTCLRLLYVFL